MSNPKIRALVGCQVDACAEERSLPLHDVRKHDGLPICEVCWEEEGGDWDAWDALPLVTLADLSE